VGWQPGSNMAQKYIDYFGNESSESLLEAYGIVTKNNVPIDTLTCKPQDAKFCSKCKMIISFDRYQEVLQEQQGKDRDLQSFKE
jgi:integrase/recombinase XerD